MRMKNTRESFYLARQTLFSIPQCCNQYYTFIHVPAPGETQMKREDDKKIDKRRQVVK